jgi:signal transduction histidine kinase
VTAGASALASRPIARARALAARVRHPRTTVRWRLALLYGALFLVCGAALLGVTYGLVAQATSSRAGPAQVRKIAARAAGPNVRHAVPTRLPQSEVKLPASEQLPPGVRAVLRSHAGQFAVAVAGSTQRIADLHQLEIESGIALAIMAILSAGLGWLVAGRVLRPVRAMTVATQEISEANLHRRLELAGPPDELRTLGDTIDGLLERLEGAFVAQRRFVANASHELRTPLTASRAVLEMVLSDPHATVADFRAASRDALEESAHSAQLIDALLTLAQGQQGPDQVEPTDLAATTATVLDELTPAATARGLAVTGSLAPATVSGDPRLLQRLIANLLQNAIRHNVEAGTISVDVSDGDGQARLLVSNSGPEVPADQLQRLTEPFQRLGPERVGQDGGVGLGLSIVAAIADAHGATLRLSARAGGGLDVEVRFPVASELS